MPDKGKERRAENAGIAVTKNGKENTTANPKFERWVESINLMLGCVSDDYVKACSISIVPEHIRKLKVEAYMPKVVSIGPLHRRTRGDLVYMEEIKWRCMQHLLHRTKDANKSVEKCHHVLFALDEIVRASYNAGDIKFDSYDLAKIMLLDGCFLLELLISNDKDSNTEFKCRFGTVSPGAEAGKREEVLSDLTVLENQIPLFILNELFTTLFPNEDEDHDDDKDKERIKKLALSLLGYSASSVPNSHHFLELVHSFITGTSEHEEGNGYVAIDVETSAEVKDDSHVKLKRCATRLQAAGVTIKPPNAEIKPSDMADGTQSSAPKQLGISVISRVAWFVTILRTKRHVQRKPGNDPEPADIRFDLNIKFSESSGELTIPPLHITETTQVKWRNFIAWELLRNDKAEFMDGEGERVSCKFIWYALFFQGLICSVQDIQLLRDKKVIVVHDAKRGKQGEKKIMNNEDLLDFFRKITEGVVDAQIHADSKLCSLFGELNSYRSADRTTQARRVTWHFCSCIITGTWFKSRNAYRTLKREYFPTGWKLVALIAAVAGLGLTATQTGLAARSL